MQSSSVDLPYRPAIDGLRAVAVLAVVLFHIDTKLVPGGFVGVDVFFVISGYLITSNIQRQFAAGRFSFLDFYARRLRRIYPALVLVLLITLVAGAFILLPEHYDELARSAIASIFSAANIFFTYFVDTGYFAEDSATKPLLHIWSLGVEEQFYLLWPLAAVGLLKLRLDTPKRLGVLAAVTAGLVVLSEWLVRYDADFAYYMLPSRAFELLLGALVALAPRVPGSGVVRNFLAAAGAASLAFSLVFIREYMPFPGVYALPSTVGAALIIYAGGGRSPTAVDRVLSIPPMLWFGWISYSLYLWHWPILAYLRYSYVEIDFVSGALAFIAMTAASWLSYSLVETPFRRWRATPARVFSMLLAIPTASVTVLAGLVVWSGGQLLWKSNDYEARLARFNASNRPPSEYDYVCQVPLLTEKYLTKKSCIINGKDEPDTLLWGDSHGAHYVGVLGEIAKAEGVSFRNAAHSGCPPVFDKPESYTDAKYQERCKLSVERIAAKLPSYGTVVLAGRWNYYVERDSHFLDAVDKTVAQLADEGKKVVVLGQIPEIPGFDRKCELKRLKFPDLSCINLQSQPYKGPTEVNMRLKQIALAHGARYFDVDDAVCRDGTCTPYLDDQVVYFDKTHFSMEGSWNVGKWIVARQEPELFQRMLSDASTAN